ncbi:MAG: hypothetical protein HUU28_04665 [Planctomycetaceae bacterium]|nr:hypothetical protein [Planctomycetaceae bacterium]
MLGTLVLGGACGRYREVFHGNGQIALVKTGSTNLSGEREGLWVYYDEEGELLFEQSYGSESYLRTGVYENGVRVRLPNEEELAAAAAIAERKMKNRR